MLSRVFFSPFWEWVGSLWIWENLRHFDKNWAICIFVVCEKCFKIDHSSVFSIIFLRFKLYSWIGKWPKCWQKNKQTCAVIENLTIYCLLQNLREVLTNLIPEKQEEVKKFRAEHGKTVVGNVTVDSVLNSHILSLFLGNWA